jgi:hypothetical protein
MDDGATTAELRSFNKMSPNRGTEVSTRQQLAPCFAKAKSKGCRECPTPPRTSLTLDFSFHRTSSNATWTAWSVGSWQELQF